MKTPWFKCLILYATISGISLAAEIEPKRAPLIPTGINTVLGSIRAGMTVDEVVKKFRAFYPEARMMEISGGLATGSANISLGDGIEIGLRVRPTSERNVWMIADNTPVSISDYKKLQAIKVQLVPIRVINTKQAEQGRAHQSTTRPESKF